jgi:polyvinyl alcohol dehydrogenase (cytochrome)
MNRLITYGMHSGARRRGGTLAVAFVALCLALCAAGPPSSAWAAPAKAGGVSGDWPMFMHDVGRSGFNGGVTLATPLSLVWTHTAANAGMTLNPIVGNSLVYAGSADGFLRAVDQTGKLVWTSPYLGQTYNCSPTSHWGVSSTPALASVTLNGVATSVLYVGAGNTLTAPMAEVYALNATSGAPIWHTTLSAAKGVYMWASPVVFTPSGAAHPSVYIGLSSVEDCPLVRGGLYQLDAVTGVIQHVFYTEPLGCVGASVWGSPTIDAAAGTLYFATGNGASATKCTQPQPYAVALVELNLSNLAFIGSWQVPATQQIVDSDFGTTPTLFSATIGGTVTPLVGLVNKSGEYYAFKRGQLVPGPVWMAKIANGGGAITGSLSSSAWDGTQLYVAGGLTTISGKSCKGSMRALNPATGTFVWQACFTGAAVTGAIAAAAGIVVACEGRTVNVVNSTTGTVIATYHDNAAGLLGAASITFDPLLNTGVLYFSDNAGNMYELK